MDIVYVFDDNFSVCAAVSIASLLENNRDNSFHFHIFDDGISGDSKSNLEEICREYNARISFVDVRPVCERLKALGVEPWRGRYSAYVKLMVSDFLPPDLQRVIVLDADTVIDGSICELHSMDLHGHPCAMALEGIHGDYNEICGIGNAELYNTGVIVYDLPVWRKKEVEKRFVEHLTTVRSRYMLPEEVPISIVLKNDVERLSPKYNFITQFYLYGSQTYFRRFHWDRLGGKFYSIEDIQEARSDIRIYHCIDTFTSRPWYKESIHPYNDLYDRYLLKTPWKNEPKKSQAMSGVAKLEYQMRKNLPDALSNYMYYVAATLFYTLKAKKFYEK